MHAKINKLNSQLKGQAEIKSFKNWWISHPLHDLYSNSSLFISYLIRGGKSSYINLRTLFSYILLQLVQESSTSESYANICRTNAQQKHFLTQLNKALKNPAQFPTSSG